MTLYKVHGSGESGLTSQYRYDFWTKFTAMIFWLLCTPPMQSNKETGFTVVLRHSTLRSILKQPEYNYESGLLVLANDLNHFHYLKWNAVNQLSIVYPGCRQVSKGIATTVVFFLRITAMQQLCGSILFKDLSYIYRTISITKWLS